MKKCSRCGKEKNKSEFNFQNKDKGMYVSACKECVNKAQRKKRACNPEETRARDKIQYMRHREKRIIQAREYRKKYPNRTRNTNLKVKYGISQDDYDQIKKKQDNKCAICGEDEKNLKRILCVDHCHTTKEVRGLLCDTCNKFLGFYENLGEKCKIYLN